MSAKAWDQRRKRKRARIELRAAWRALAADPDRVVRFTSDLLVGVVAMSPQRHDELIRNLRLLEDLNARCGQITN